MPTSFSFGKIQFDVSLGKSASGVAREPDAPFLLAVIGDFSGRANRGLMEPLAARRPVLLDFDKFERAFKAVGANLQLPLPEGKAGSLNLRFDSMDDLHPDRILKQVPELFQLTEVRKRLLNSSTAAGAAGDAQRLLGNFAAPSVPESAPASPSAESNQETMARLLGGTPPSAPVAGTNKPAATGVDIHALIKGIVAPSVVPNASPEQVAALSAVEAELASQLRGILHHPAFQELEATWRGLDLLVRAHGAEENLKLYMFDVSKAELMADLKAQEELASAGFYKAMRDGGWAVLLGAFTFDETVEEIEALGRMAKTAALLGAPFLAGASPRWVGCDSLTSHPHPDEWLLAMPAASREAWASLRALPEASYLGLTMPRVLLRQPYGKGSDPIESLPFEELAGVPAHDGFLWGCGSFVCGYLLADAFLAEGWDFTPGGSGELDDLPVYKFVRDGETTVQPCAEAWLSERAGERVLSEGLMPLLSIKGRGAVRLVSLQSVSQSAKALSLPRS